MRRRKFVAMLGGIALACSGVGSAQSARMRRIAVMVGYPETDPEAQKRVAALIEALAPLGWVSGKSAEIQVRWTGGDFARASVVAKEVVALEPDVIVSSTTPTTAALQRATGSIPIVFATVSDPVGSGFVKSLAHPGGNITGFLNLEGSLAEKWLQLFRDVAPAVRTVAVMFNPKTASFYEYYLQPLRTVAPKLGLKLSSAPVADPAEIEQLAEKLGRSRENGLLVMNDSANLVHRKVIIASAARRKVPAVYPFAAPYVDDGGLVGYGVDSVELYRRTASYVDRVLRGAKPAELPVELANKFELAVNVKTAKALGLKLKPSFLARADRVVE